MQGINYFSIIDPATFNIIVPFFMVPNKHTRFGMQIVTKYQFLALGRNHNSPADCLRLNDSLDQTVLQAVQRLYDRRRQPLGPMDLNS